MGKLLFGLKVSAEEVGGGGRAGVRLILKGVLGGFNAAAIDMDSLLALQASGTVYSAAREEEKWRRRRNEN